MVKKSCLLCILTQTQIPSNFSHMHTYTRGMPLFYGLDGIMPVPCRNFQQLSNAGNYVALQMKMSLITIWSKLVPVSLEKSSHNIIANKWIEQLLEDLIFLKIVLFFHFKWIPIVWYSLIWYDVMIQQLQKRDLVNSSRCLVLSLLLFFS